MTIDSRSRRALLVLARAAIADAVGAPPAPTLHAFDESLPVLEERRGVFVTLSMRARLRGCIGRVEPDAPLRVLVPEMARAAAVADPRFPILRARELPTIEIEISLLSPLELITDPAGVEVGRHGLLVAARGSRGLLLPQVPLQYGWSREEFLSETCLKAGLEAQAWRSDRVALHVFTAEVFGEDDED